MEINVNFFWCDYIFQWKIDWNLPVLPSKGDCLFVLGQGRNSFVSEKDNVKYQNVRLKGKGKYEGYIFELWQLFNDPLQVRLKEIAWNKDNVEIIITTQCWEEGPENEWYWEAIDPDRVLRIMER
ncbi:hypothetical protein [Prevotella intermedia]|uniref:hypothetical protein n=1 Tax=Prevotella intermedia TaxID=28131 RepID=UPI000CC53167|nr:hypothetical protein [Prevotella intermedia]PJI21430.1 hypothetical protein CTM45_11495 [Prevotella intermedia]